MKCLCLCKNAFYLLLFNSFVKNVSNQMTKVSQCWPVLCEYAHLNVMVPWPFSHSESMSIHWCSLVGLPGQATVFSRTRYAALGLVHNDEEMQAPIPLPTLR